MTVIYEQGNCKLINHHRPVQSFIEDDGKIVNFQLKTLLFDNFKRKQKKISKICDETSEFMTQVENFRQACIAQNLFSPPIEDDTKDKVKTENIALMNKFYDCSSSLGSFHGENNLETGKITTLNHHSYLFPPRCKFFNKKIEDLDACLLTNEANQFDFICVDPPWENRYIKRVKKATANKQGYLMMTDDEIMAIPLENYVKKSSIVVIWCTNSESHIKMFQEQILVKWNLKLLSTWQWVKVDKHGELFCAIDGNKKPFEQIFIATHKENEEYDKELKLNCLLFSQPSSIHSHKPPLKGKNS